MVPNDASQLTKNLSLTVGEATVRDRRGRVVRRESYLESLPLIVALSVIKENATEPHTNRNLGKIIEMIRDLHPTL